MDPINITRKELHVLFFSLLLVPLFFFGSGIFVGNYISGTPPQHLTEQDLQTGMDETTERGQPPTNQVTVQEEGVDLSLPTIDQLPIADKELILREKPETGEEPLTTEIQVATENQAAPAGIITVEEVASGTEASRKTTDTSNAYKSQLLAGAKPQLTMQPAEKSPDESSYESNKEPTTDTATAFPQFAAQVGLFTEKARADRWKSTLDPRFTYTVLPKPDSDKTRYSVVIGPYLSKAEARIMVDRYKLVTENDAFVVKLLKDVKPQVAGL
ncbi:SPOR domain-containing protein [Hahella ganghwensis]|uniref:SPOR domain-containing protein n=1 Tax=Hahella ganghwensis TaxID=286420 RepID=UPI00037DBA5B|nr:SPOR domain-containing protein [Hahella ganghwensis]